MIIYLVAVGLVALGLWDLVWGLLCLVAAAFQLVLGVVPATLNWLLRR